jgi:cation diffusion facilitator family transporter
MTALGHPLTPFAKARIGPAKGPDTPKIVRQRAAMLSIIAGAIILGIKYYAAAISGSAALWSDAIESVVNIIGATFAYAAVRIADKSPDREHPYGHGKIESFSAAFEGSLIALAAAFIAWEAIDTLYEQLFLGVYKLKDLGRGVAWNFAAGVLNGGLGLFLIFIGKIHKSEALKADGHHVLSDFLTTLGVLFGLLLVKMTGLNWLDPLMALLVAILLARTGIKLLRQSSQSLMDKEDPELLEKLIESINRVRPPEVIALHEMRTIRSGRHTHVEVHVVLPGHYPLEKTHALGEAFAKNAILAAGIEGEMQTHVDPCQQSWCVSCAVDGCTMRQDRKSVV